MSTALMLPEPAGDVDVDVLWDQVAQALAVIEEIDDLAQAEELRARAAALEEYLARRAQDAAPAMIIARHLEARIGHLLGPPVTAGPGRGKPSVATDGFLPRTLRMEFRLLDRYRGVWEADAGRPRRQILAVINRWRRRVVDADARAVDVLQAEDVAGDEWVMLAGELADRVADLPPGRVDLIVTDPPYPTEMLGAWSELAEEAARLLKPQGILVALSGKIVLPAVIDRLREYLTYGWVYCQPLPGSSSRILGRHIGQCWKPWLAFSNGPWPSGRVDWHPDLLDGAPLAKTHYRWEQSVGPALQLIHFLAPEGGLVADLFAGTGTYGVAALQAGRRFLGVEADRDRFAVAVGRLRQHEKEEP